jgi:hypothetical protein
LLTLHEKDPQDAKQWIEVNLDRLQKAAAKETEWLSLSSPINRTEHWRDAFTTYQSHVDVNIELISILKPKKYIIRLASKDLGVKRWIYSDEKQLVDKNEESSQNAKAIKLINSKPTASNAAFTLVKSLSWPPRIETRMRLCASSNVQPSDSTTLEVSVTNTGFDLVTVQTRGRQRVLIPWGPFQPEPDADDDRPRILDPTLRKPPTSSLQIVQSSTGEVIRGNEKQRGIAPLMDSNADQRPKVKDLVTLKLGAPVIRKFDIGALVNGLEDGQYKILMRSKCCRWWPGEVEAEEGGAGKVPAHLCRAWVPPLMLESTDEVEICIREGKVEFAP